MAEPPGDKVKLCDRGRGERVRNMDWKRIGRDFLSE